MEPLFEAAGSVCLATYRHQLPGSNASIAAWSPRRRLRGARTIVITACLLAGLPDQVQHPCERHDPR